MTATIGAILTANGEALVKAAGGALRTVSQDAKAVSKEIAGSTAGAIALGFKDGMRGIERDYRASIKSLEDLTRSASLTNGAVRFDRSAHNAELVAARENLVVQQRLAAAIDVVAAERGADAVAARIQAAASAAAVARAEEEVRALELKTRILDRLQDELGGAAVAQRRFNSLTGEARQGAQQLSYNLADVASGVAAGIPPMQIFAQQGTQVVQALQLMSNKTSGFIGFLSGPWGLAITSAITVLGSFVFKMFEGADASDKLKLNIDVQKNSYEALTKAVREYNETQRDSAAVTRANTEEARKQTLELIRQAKAQIAAALASERANAGQGTVPGGASAISGARARSKREELIELEKQLREDEKALANQSVERRLNKETDITARYGEELRKLELRYDAGRVSAKKYADERERLLKLQEKELEAARKAKRESAGNGAAAASRDARVGDMTALIKQLFPGAVITSTTGGRHAKGSDHYAGRAIDFVPGGGMGRYSTAEVEAILEAAGVDIRRNAKGTKQLFGPGRSASRPGDHDDHFHVAWKGSPDPERAAEAAARADAARVQKAAELARAISNATEQATALRGQFDPLPADIDRANNALIDIEKQIAAAQSLLKKGGLGKDQVAELEAAIKSLESTRETLVPASLTKPLTDNIAAMREQVEAQRLIIDGRMAEYNTMQDNLELARLLGAESLAQLPAMIEKRKISQDQLATYYRQQQVLRMQTIELQRHQREQQKLLNVVEDVESATKQAIYDFFDGKGLGAAKSFFKSLFDIQKRAMTEEVFTAIFGDAFEKQKLKILGLDKVDEAGTRLAGSIDTTVPHILALGRGAIEAAEMMRAAANDNLLPVGGAIGSGLPGSRSGGAQYPGEIVVTAASKAVKGAISPEIKKLLSGIGDKISTALRGAAYGQASSGVLRSIGVKQSGAGASIGGALGGAAFEELFSKTLGKFAGPIGGIVGGLLGGTIGGLLKKTPRGYATIGGSAGSPLSITGTGGNSKSAREAGMGAAGEVIGSIESIAEALGGTYDASRGSVSIGRSGDSWHVDTTGKGRLKKSQGGQDFNDDYEAAVRAATMDLIKDGVITGISAAAQRELQAGGDLQKAIQKASLIESIPKLLKARTNPVAAALDELNDKWAKTVAVLKEGAATAEQFADAEKLYQMERDDIMKAANDNLKEFINGLNFGPNSGLSLRDQSAAARANVQPYLDAIAKGDIGGIDREKYLAAADSYLQLSRALNGSGSGYFANVDELRKATQSLLDQSESQSKAAEARDPFAEATAQNTKDAANILSDQTELLKRIEAGIAALGGGAPFDFIGTARNFVNRSAA